MSPWIRALHGGATGNIGINRLQNSTIVALGYRHDLQIEDTSVYGSEGWAQDVVFNDRW